MNSKAKALKFVNAILAVLMATQAVSALLLESMDSDVVEGVHVLGGISLIILSAAHLALNWGWVKATFLKPPASGVPTSP